MMLQKETWKNIEKKYFSVEDPYKAIVNHQTRNVA